jgi:hypothetical protein
MSVQNYMFCSLNLAPEDSGLAPVLRAESSFQRLGVGDQAIEPVERLSLAQATLSSSLTSHWTPIAVAPSFSSSATASALRCDAAGRRSQLTGVSGDCTA